MGAAGLARNAYCNRREEIAREREDRDRHREETMQLANAIKQICDSTKEDVQTRPDYSSLWVVVRRRLENSLDKDAKTNTTDKQDSPKGSQLVGQQRAALHALRGMSEPNANGVYTPHMKNEAADAKVVAPLIGLIEHGASETVRSEAAERLAALTSLSHARNQRLACEYKAPEKVCALLVACSRPSSRLSAMKSLASLMQGCNAAKNAGRIAGLHQELLRIIRESSREGEVVAAMETMASLLEENRLNQTLATKHGLLSVCIATLRNASNDNRRQAALWLLKTMLTNHEENQRGAVASGVIAVVVQTVETVQTHSRAQLHALSVLHVLFTLGSDVRQEALDAGVQSTLRRVVKTTKQARWFRKQALSRTQRAASELLRVLASRRNSTAAYLPSLTMSLSLMVLVLACALWHLETLVPSQVRLRMFDAASNAAWNFQAAWSRPLDFLEEGT